MIHESVLDAGDTQSFHIWKNSSILLEEYAEPEEEENVG
jgi:hypothetical protein